MESMGRKKPRPRRSFTAEFKAEIVELCQRGDGSVGQVVLKPGGRAALTCWEPLDRNDERLSPRVRRANLGAGLRQAGFPAAGRNATSLRTRSWNSPRTSPNPELCRP
jgi:transposase-like protein